MLEMCLMLLVAAVLLPDIVFGGVLALLWLVEKLVLSACQVISVMLALWAWRGASIGSAWPHRRAHRPPTAP
jgi:hypothetical protein